MTTAQIHRKLKKLMQDKTTSFYLQTAIRAAANGDYTTAEKLISCIDDKTRALATVLNH